MLSIKSYKTKQKIESGECLQTLNGHSGGIYCLVYLPNGNLASCSNDATIKVWDLVRGECIQTLRGLYINFKHHLTANPGY